MHLHIYLDVIERRILGDFWSILQSLTLFYISWFVRHADVFLRIILDAKTLTFVFRAVTLTQENVAGYRNVRIQSFQKCLIDSEIFVLQCVGGSILLAIFSAWRQQYLMKNEGHWIYRFSVLKTWESTRGSNYLYITKLQVSFNKNKITIWIRNFANNSNTKNLQSLWETKDLSTI